MNDSSCHAHSLLQQSPTMCMTSRQLFSISRTQLMENVTSSRSYPSPHRTQPFMVLLGQAVAFALFEKDAQKSCGFFQLLLLKLVHVFLLLFFLAKALCNLECIALFQGPAYPVTLVNMYNWVPNPADGKTPFGEKTTIVHNFFLLADWFQKLFISSSLCHNYIDV